MKKLFALTLALLVAVAMTACAQQNTNNPSAPSSAAGGTEKNTTQSQQTISKESAIEFALQAASVDRGTVFDIGAELDREKGKLVWEVDFETQEYEYSYVINAYDGKVISSHRERND